MTHICVENQQETEEEHVTVDHIFSLRRLFAAKSILHQQLEYSNSQLGAYGKSRLSS